MIISQTPFRISFAGGGSDLPDFYRKEGGAVLSTTINKYMYIALHPYFDPEKIFLKYSKTELCDSPGAVAHPILRAILAKYGLKGVDINSIADIPGGTGLGSSSAFTVGVLHAVNAYVSKYVSPSFLAEEACRIEIDELRSPIGKQDQYAAAYGGMNYIEFNPDETVCVRKVVVSGAVRRRLNENMVMLYTETTRSANDILKEQKYAISSGEKRGTQKELLRLALDLKNCVERESVGDFGRILHEGWLLKKSMANGISNDAIDAMYEKGIKAGAEGGKLLGAGGGGFMLFYCDTAKQERFRQAMAEYREVPFRFENSGSRIIFTGEG